MFNLFKKKQEPVSTTVVEREPTVILRFELIESFEDGIPVVIQTQMDWFPESKAEDYSALSVGFMFVFGVPRAFRIWRSVNGEYVLVHERHLVNRFRFTGGHLAIRGNEIDMYNSSLTDSYVSSYIV